MNGEWGIRCYFHSGAAADPPLALDEIPDDYNVWLSLGPDASKGVTIGYQGATTAQLQQLNSSMPRIFLASPNTQNPGTVLGPWQGLPQGLVMVAEANLNPAGLNVFFQKRRK
jgi:hypothetical protein